MSKTRVFFIFFLVPLCHRLILFQNTIKIYYKKEIKWGKRTYNDKSVITYVDVVLIVKLISVFLNASCQSPWQSSVEQRLNSHHALSGTFVHQSGQPLGRPPLCYPVFTCSDNTPSHPSRWPRELKGSRVGEGMLGDMAGLVSPRSIS